MNKMTIGQYIPGSSYWHGADPRAKMIVNLIFIIACFLIGSWGLMIAIIVLELLAIRLTKIPWIYFIRSLKPIIFFVILTVLLQVLFHREGQPIFQLGFFQLTDAGLMRGIFMASRLIVVILASTLLTLTTKPSDLTLALESLMKPLKKVKFPVSEFALMVAIALRFIPTLFEETGKILKSQASRGVDISEGSLKEKISQLISLLVPLFVLAFNRADELSNAMEIRGYVPGKKRTSLKLLRWRIHDTVLLSIGVSVFLLAIVF